MCGMQTHVIQYTDWLYVQMHLMLVETYRHRRGTMLLPSLPFVAPVMQSALFR